MKTIFKGNKFSIVWNIFNSSTKEHFDFTGMNVELHLYSENCKTTPNSFVVLDGTISTEIEANSIPTGVYNLVCRYSTQTEHGYCIYKYAFQITSKDCECFNTETIVLNSYATFIDPSSEIIRIEKDIELSRYGFNVTVNGLVGGTHTIDSAIKNVPGKFRMLGQKITFRGKDGEWKTYHNESLSLAHYENPNDWVLDDGITKVIGDVNIENNPDYEDLTEAGDGTIKFADKEYNKGSFSGLGRIYLRKNIVNGVNVLTQDMILKENTRYIIQYDYDLQGKDIPMPKGCVLCFDGGCLSNGTLILNKTAIMASPTKIFDAIELKGTLSADYLLLEWFGAVGDGVTDDTNAWLQVKNFLKINGGTLTLLNKVYAMQPINLVGLSNICIQGFGFSRSPWKTTTCIKIISEGEVGIRCTGDYQEEPTFDNEGNILTKGQVPTEYATAVLLKDFYLDCNNKVNKGINCHFNVEIQNVEVRYSLGDGIVLEAETYPVRLKNVQTFYNKKDGVRVVAHNTTVYHIEGLESTGNGGYGLHIEGGNTCSIKNAILQSNKRGGLLLKKRKDEEFRHGQWIGSLLFEGLYIEASGTLSESDEMYDGNYAVKCVGLSADRLFVGKIDYVTFLNCKANASSTGRTSFFEGIGNLRIIASLGFDVDWTKNIEYSIGTTRTSSLMIGDFGNQPLKKYDERRNERFFIEVSSASGRVKTEQTLFNLQLIGGFLSAHGVIQYSISGERLNERVILNSLNNKYNRYNIYSQWTIVGSGYIESTEDGVDYKKEILVELEPFGDFCIKDKVGNTIVNKDLPATGNIKLCLNYCIP